jgi:hypothetical protein
MNFRWLASPMMGPLFMSIGVAALLILLCDGERNDHERTQAILSKRKFCSGQFVRHRLDGRRMLLRSDGYLSFSSRIYYLALVPVPSGYEEIAIVEGELELDPDQKGPWVER